MKNTNPGDTTGQPMPRRPHRVRVWFGSQVVCGHDAELAKAHAYADAMARRYAGLRVTIDGRNYRPGSR